MQELEVLLVPPAVPAESEEVPVGLQERGAAGRDEGAVVFLPARRGQLWVAAERRVHAAPVGAAELGAAGVAPPAPALALVGPVRAVWDAVAEVPQPDAVARGRRALEEAGAAETGGGCKSAT